MKIFKVACICTLILTFSLSAFSQAADGAPAGADAGQIPVEVKYKVLFDNEALDEYTESEYDESLTNLLIQRRYSASGTLLEQVEYTYPADQNVVMRKTTRSADNQIRTQVDYQYNTQGDLLSETVKNKDGKTVSSYLYSYDVGRNRIKRVLNNGAGIKMAETAYSYDGKGNNIATETFSGTGQKINSTQTQYDNAGHLISQKIFSANGRLASSTAVTWDGEKEIKTEQFGPNGEPQVRITNEYGPDGELLKKTIEDLRDNTTQILAYEYIFKPVSR